MIGFKGWSLTGFNDSVWMMGFQGFHGFKWVFTGFESVRCGFQKVSMGATWVFIGVDGV